MALLIAMGGVLHNSLRQLMSIPDSEFPEPSWAGVGLSVLIALLCIFYILKKHEPHT